MQALTPDQDFEVYCLHCNVSFPKGARRCLHCGGRLSPHRSVSGRMPLESLPEVEVLEEPEERRRALSPLALIWILIFLAGTVYRACTEG